jgi:hypothetical protein
MMVLRLLCMRLPLGIRGPASAPSTILGSLAWCCRVRMCEQVVEMVFSRGLVKVLFATETFAMGAH